MSLQCKGCGRLLDENNNKCICGYDNEGWGLMDYCEIDNGEKQMKIMKNSHTDKEFAIKEIDSWTVTFSLSDKCFYLRTPALHPFSLKLSIDDMEGLLEFAYQVTGREKTMRKLNVSAGEMSDLIEKVQKMIANRILKMPLEPENTELEEIVDLINLKLKK